MSEITPNTPNPVREDAYVEELAEKLGIDPQYIPKSPVWRNEEEIRAIAEMFANMSGGGSSGGGVLVVHMVDDHTDKTWKEIFDAPMAVIVEESSVPGIGTNKIIDIVARVIHYGSEYSVFYYAYSTSTPGEFTIEEIKLVTDSENGYLTWAE